MGIAEQHYRALHMASLLVLGKVHDCSTAIELNVPLPRTPNRMILFSTVANTPIFEGSK